MRRFSVAVSDALFARIDEVAVLKGHATYYSRKPWSRDATAAWLLGEAVRRLEELNQLPAPKSGAVNQAVDGER